MHRHKECVVMHLHKECRKITTPTNVLRNLRTLEANFAQATTVVKFQGLEGPVVACLGCMWADRRV